MIIKIKPNFNKINNSFSSYKFNPTRTNIKSAKLEGEILIQDKIDWASINKFNYLQSGKYSITDNFEIIKIQLDKHDNLELDLITKLNIAANNPTKICLTKVSSKNLLLITFEKLEFGLQIISTNEEFDFKLISLNLIRDYLPDNNDLVIDNINVLSSTKTSNNLLYFAINLECKKEGSKLNYLAICTINLNSFNEFNIINLLEGNNGEVIQFDFNMDEFKLISTTQFSLIYPKIQSNACSSNGELNPDKVNYSDGLFNNIKWYQTSEDITVSINLNTLIQKDLLTCSLTKNELKLSYKSIELNNEWFGPITSNESYWTIENNQFLTLYLQKFNEKTRWPHLFLEDDNILESLDPSELLTITEKLEKYTTGEEGPYQTNTLHDQFEDEIGDSIIITIKRDDTLELTNELVRDQSWLGLPLPLVDEDQNIPASVAMRYDVHGLVYDLNTLEHVQTLPAIGYIQASKKQRKFTYYHPVTFNTIIVEYTQNLFIYFNPVNNENGVQKVITLNDNEEIIGVSGFLNSNDLLILTKYKLYYVNLE